MDTSEYQSNISRKPRLDLNLLYALRALLVEQNVTRAAELMHVSQPAMSGILSRLRDHFNDPLIVPLGRRMQLTPLGESLIAPITGALVGIEAALVTEPVFDPATSTRRFSIVATDYVFSVLLQALLRRLRREAPNIAIDLTAPTRLSAAHLDAGEVDLFIIPEAFSAPDHPLVRLFEDDHRIIADLENEAIGESVSLEKYLELRHVICRQENPTHFDTWFSRQFEDRRRIDLVLSSFTQLAMSISGTDRVGTVLTRYGRQLAQLLPIKLARIEFGDPQTRFVVQWHRQRELDLGLKWLREQIVREAAPAPPNLRMT